MYDGVLTNKLYQCFPIYVYQYADYLPVVM